MTAIISSDILIADVITPLEGNHKLHALVEKYALLPGGKLSINAAQFDEFTSAISGYPITIAPGGSSANVLVTLSKLLGKSVDISFIGTIGDGLSSRMIRESLEEAHIKLLPTELSHDVVPKTAMSYVIMFPCGQRTIATYPGNASEVLKPEMISEALIKNADAVLIQGSLWMKMGADYANRLYNLSQQFKKEIWLALPTYSMPSGQHSEVFKGVIAAADIVLGNEEELARIYDSSPDVALQKLQQNFSAGAGQIGFITRGDKGAALVVANKIELISSHKADCEIVNSLGAGDTAFAGFLAGCIMKKSPAHSAAIAMALALAKLSVNAARLPDPRLVLKTLLPESVFIID